MGRHKTGRRGATAARSKWEQNVDRRHLKVRPVRNRGAFNINSQLVRLVAS